MDSTRSTGLPAAAPLPSAAYWRAALEDEYRLAQLLRWGNLARPEAVDGSFMLMGTNGSAPGANPRLARTFLPRWRRNWASAGELVALCGLNLQQGPETVAVSARMGYPVVARFADFPSHDAAIWFALCHAAIGYLEAQATVQDATRAAQLAQRAAGNGARA
jgi:hypothetical protein